jgi:hypothetical protein
MFLNPRKESPMKVTTFSKIGATVGAACLIVGALAMPASADPVVTDPISYGHLVGLGSDTTQDVVNGLAAVIGGNKVASYDAIGSATVITREGGVVVPRGSNSGAGRDALRVAIGQVASASIATGAGTVSATGANSLGQLDFARSSSGPGSDALNTGVLAYIPFARDAVSVAVDPDSPLAVVPFIVGNSETAGPTTPSLYNLYRGNVKWAYISGSAADYSYVGVGATDTVPAEAPEGTTAYKIQPYLPKAGSGTRSFFIGKLGGVTDTTINALPAGTVKSKFINDDEVEVDVQEHDGSVVDGDLTAVVPFSIAQWVAQANHVQGVTDRRHGAVILGMNGVQATTGTTTFATNPAFTALVRDVYNIVPSKLADDASTDIAKTFVGSSSLVCAASTTITAYGFLLMPGTTADTTCGYKGLRGFAASTSSVSSVEFDSTTVSANESFTAIVTVNSGNHAQGGVVNIVDANDDVVGTATVAPGATTASVEVVPTAVGTSTVFAEFIPTLSGISASNSTGTITLTTVAAPTVSSISAPATIKVGGTVPVIVWVDGAAAAGGTVTLRDGETTLATKVLTAGEQGAYLTFVAKKVTYSLTATYTAPTGSNTANSTSALKSISFVKGTATVKVGSIATVAASKNSKFNLQIAGITGVAVPSGTITITEGTKVLVDAKALTTAGKLAVTLPKLKKGTHKITITYSGDSTWASVAKANVVVKIK